MWTCPKCKRCFKTANQSHSCAGFDIREHFKNKPGTIKEIFDKLLKVVDVIGKVEIDCTKSSIFLKISSTYIGIKTRKDRMVIEFYLDREHNGFPVMKTLKISKNRIVHEVHLHSPDDVDNELISLLKESYLLLQGNVNNI